MAHEHPPIVAPAPAVLDEADSARYVGKSRGFLKKCRRFGTGPAFVRVGRSVSYRIVDLDDWLDRHVVQPAV